MDVVEDLITALKERKLYTGMVHKPCNTAYSDLAS